MNLSNVQARQLLDGGITPDYDLGTIQLRDGTQPTSADDAATGTLLATITMPADAFPASVDDTPGALATANAVSTVQGVAAGTVTWARCFRSGGSTVIMDMTLNTDFTMTNPVIGIGSDIDTDSFTLFQPESE